MLMKLDDRFQVRIMGRDEGWVTGWTAFVYDEKHETQRVLTDQRSQVEALTAALNWINEALSNET